jgi:xanthine dehydrogenase accessory factor
MRELLKQLADDLKGGHPRIVCQVVETRGSTPQKAGSYMIVAPDGRQWGTLGGGCVENEVKSRSLMTLQPGQCLVSSYVLDHDYAWADGLICGGKMVMLSQRVEESAFADYAQAWAALDEAGHGFREAIVQAADLSLQTTVGQRLLINSEGVVAATWAGTPSPQLIELVSTARVTTQRPVTTAGVSIIQWPARVELLIVGAGHVGQAVAEIAARAGFEVVVADDRREFASADRFPTARKLIVGPFESMLAEHTVSQRTYALIVTRGHGHDQEALGLLANTPAAYVGLIGSRRKIKMIVESLKQEGLPEQALARVRAPIGLPIGSQSVFEIAVSVVAELIAWRNLGEEAARTLAGPAAHLLAPESCETLPSHTRAEQGRSGPAS